MKAEFMRPLASRQGVFGSRAAFTLVELLVVVAIISVLAALLLPTMQGALGTARMASCLHNLKQVGLSTCLYADDFGGWIPAWEGDPGGYTGTTLAQRWDHSECNISCYGSIGLGKLLIDTGYQTPAGMICPAKPKYPEGDVPWISIYDPARYKRNDNRILRTSYHLRPTKGAWKSAYDTMPAITSSELYKMGQIPREVFWTDYMFWYSATSPASWQHKGMGGAQNVLYGDLSGKTCSNMIDRYVVELNVGAQVNSWETATAYWRMRKGGDWGF